MLLQSQLPCVLHMLWTGLYEWGHHCIRDLFLFSQGVKHSITGKGLIIIHHHWRHIPQLSLISPGTRRWHHSTFTGVPLTSSFMILIPCHVRANVPASLWAAPTKALTAKIQTGPKGASQSEHSLGSYHVLSPTCSSNTLSGLLDSSESIYIGLHFGRKISCLTWNLGLRIFFPSYLKNATLVFWTLYTFWMPDVICTIIPLCNVSFFLFI